MASPAAVARRRENRRQRRAIREFRESRRCERTGRLWTDEAAIRLVRINFPGIDFQFLPAIVFSYAYWQARACGWDVLRREWRRDSGGNITEAALCVTWVWWTNLPFAARRHVVLISRRKRI